MKYFDSASYILATSQGILFGERDCRHGLVDSDGVHIDRGGSQRVNEGERDATSARADVEDGDRAIQRRLDERRQMGEPVLSLRPRYEGRRPNK